MQPRGSQEHSPGTKWLRSSALLLLGLSDLASQAPFFLLRRRRGQGNLLHLAVGTVVAAIHLAGLFLAFDADDGGLDPLVGLQEGLAGGERGLEGDRPFLGSGLLCGHGSDGHCSDEEGESHSSDEFQRYVHDFCLS